MAEVEPGTPRYETLEVARRFKTSWVELGGALHKVRVKRLFEGWGFSSFDAYCKDEIRIKPRTAAKLTASFAFLKQEEPAVLKRDGVDRPIPDLAAVEVMRKARESEHVDDEEYRKIKDMALDDKSPAQLRKELKQVLPPPEPKPPAAILKLTDHEFHQVGIERSRARVLRVASKYADRIERLNDVPAHEATEWLQRLPGIGPWTTGLTTAIAGGDANAVPQGDLHIPRTITYALTGQEDGDDNTMLAALEPFAGHRQRVVRMVEMSGGGQPTHRPAPFRYDISRI